MRAGYPEVLDAEELLKEILATLRETRDSMKRIESILRGAANTVAEPPARKDKP